MFNLRLCNAAIIRYSQLKFGHMYLCGMDYKCFSPHCCKCNGCGCTAAIRWGNARHGPHSDSLYSGSEHSQFNSPKLVKREAGFPNPRRALIGSNQLWRVNDSPYYREYTFFPKNTNTNTLFSIKYKCKYALISIEFKYVVWKESNTKTHLTPGLLVSHTNKRLIRQKSKKIIPSGILQGHDINSVILKISGTTGDDKCCIMKTPLHFSFIKQPYPMACYFLVSFTADNGKNSSSPCSSGRGWHFER